MFKEGDTVKCVDAGFVQYLTKGKEYRVMRKSLTDTVEVVNDRGDREVHFDYRFVLVGSSKPGPTAVIEVLY